MRLWMRRFVLRVRGVIVAASAMRGALMLATFRPAVAV